MPEGWTWVKIEQIAEVVRGQMPRPAGNPKYYRSGNIPWITVGEITKDNGIYLTSTSKFINEEGKKKSRYVEPGTLLLTNSGATLGVPKITKIGGCIHDGNLALQKIDGDAKMYLYYFLASQTQNLRNINQGAAQPNLNIKMVSEIEVPLAPLPEQRRIVAKIESLFAQADAIERAVAIAQQRANKLDQAILARAFRGEL